MRTINLTLVKFIGCNCVIISTTELLLDTHFYEFLLKKILSKYRLKTNKEFFDVDELDIEMIFSFFNELNQQCDTEEKLLKYIQLNHPEYICKKRIYRSDNSNSSNKPKRKHRELFVDTSNL